MPNNYSRLQSGVWQILTFYEFINYDPWAEVEVVKMLGAVYTRGDNSMLGGKVVAEAAPMEFAPYAFLKWDMK